MKRLLTILLLLVAVIVSAQETPPALLKAVNSQFYIRLADSSMWQNKGTPYGWHRVAKYSELNDAISSISATSPIFFNTTTKLISSQAASTTLNGYVTTGSQNFAGEKRFYASGGGYVGLNSTSTPRLSFIQSLYDLNIGNNGDEINFRYNSYDFILKPASHPTSNVTLNLPASSGTLLLDNGSGSGLSGVLLTNSTTQTKTGHLSLAGGNFNISGTGSNSATGGPLIGWNNAGLSESMFFQLNASNGLDLWKNSGGYAKVARFNIGGTTEWYNTMYGTEASFSSSATGFAIQGTTSAASSGGGVGGYANVSGGIGVFGQANTFGLPSPGTGVLGTTDGSGYGIRGQATGAGYGGFFSSSSGEGIYAQSQTGIIARFQSSASLLQVLTVNQADATFGAPIIGTSAAFTTSVATPSITINGNNTFFGFSGDTFIRPNLTTKSVKVQNFAGSNIVQFNEDFTSVFTGGITGASASFTGTANADNFQVAAWDALHYIGSRLKVGGVTASQWAEVGIYTGTTQRVNISNSAMTVDVPITGTSATFSGNVSIIKTTAALTINGGYSTNSGAMVNFLGWNSGAKNWRISTAMITGGLEFAVSTANGGSTFSSNIALIDETTGAYTALSDSTKKKNFEAYKGGIANILALKPTLYNMLNQDDTEPKELGFLAQEVKDILPQAFVKSGDFIGLNYNAFIPLLVKGMQEQQAQISDNSTDLQESMKRIEALEAEVKALKSN